MLGKRSKQLGLLEADHLYLDYVGKGSFYGFLASLRGQLFRDEDFADLYCPDNGRDSVPPSLWPPRCCSSPQSERKPSRGRISTSGGRWRWGSRWRTGADCLSPADPGPGASRLSASLQFARDRLPERTADEGSGGHHLHSGPRSGQGHLQPAGRRWIQVVRALAQLESPGRGVGLETRPGAL